jgi:hypothetical protein
MKTNETKHTPGPWKIEPHHPGDKDLLIFPAYTWVDYDDVDHEQQMANARLIAAAPELLEEYSRLIERLKEASDMCYRGHSQVAEELCHEFESFVSPAIARATQPPTTEGGL